MDKIWYRNPSKSEVIGGDEKKRMTMQNRQKSNAKKINKNSSIKLTLKGNNILFCTCKQTIMYICIMNGAVYIYNTLTAHLLKSKQ